MAPSLSAITRGDPLLEAVVVAVRRHMARYDGSHDFAHIQRVLGLALYLAEEEQRKGEQPLDIRLVVLSALLHDVGDRKYLHLVKAEVEEKSGERTEDPLPPSLVFDDPGSAVVAAVLRRCGATNADADVELVRRVVLVCRHVSWSAETRSGDAAAEVAAVVARCPELAIVQDADRLDAIGAVGVARCFAFGAAQANRPLAHSLDHFDEKLVLIHSRMKTATGRRLAQERTDRLRQFQAWYRDEAAFAVEDA